VSERDEMKGVTKSEEPCNIQLSGVNGWTYYCDVHESYTDRNEGDCDL